MVHSRRLRLTWRKKKQIVDEFHRLNVPSSKNNFEKLFEWAFIQLQLHKHPGYRTLQRILKEKSLIELDSGANRSSRKQILSVQNTEVETEVLDWVYYMWNQEIYITDALIQSKARKIWTRMYESLRRPIYGSQFSSGWPHRFKKRNKFRSLKSYGESGKANVEGAANSLPILRALVRQYGEENMYNADDFGLYPGRAPD